MIARRTLIVAAAGGLCLALMACDGSKPLIKREEKPVRFPAADEGYAAKTEIGWGHQIRSYVLQPYQLVKDLRTGVTSTAPDDVLDGALDPFMAAALSQKVTGEAVDVEDVD